jgi:hypothetical protein
MQRLMVEMRLGLPRMDIPAPRKRWPGEDPLDSEAKRAGLVGRAEELQRALEHLCGTEKQRVVHIWGDPGVVGLCDA